MDLGWISSSGVSCGAAADRPAETERHWMVRIAGRTASCTSIGKTGSNAQIGRGPYEQPAAKRLRKQPKSWTFRTGATVDASQLAYESPAANLFRKHPKSWTFSTGGTVEPSQLA